MKALKIAIFFSVFGLLFSTCKKDELPPGRYINITGKILNKDGESISNVKIILGEIGTYEPKIDEFTTIVYTDSAGNFTINHFDRFTSKSGKETDDVIVYNYVHQDYMRFYHDDYLPESYSIPESRFNISDTVFIMQKSSHVKLVLNPVSKADGIAVYEYYYNHPFYVSNLYARGNEQPNCRRDNPRYKEFNYIVVADTDIKYKWETFSGGACYASSLKEKTMRSNPDNKDTLIFQIDY